VPGADNKVIVSHSEFRVNRAQYGGGVYFLPIGEVWTVSIIIIIYHEADSCAICSLSIYKTHHCFKNGAHLMNYSLKLLLYSAILTEIDKMVGKDHSTNKSQLG